VNLLLAQDEPGEYDDVYTVDDYCFVIDKDLVKLANPIIVDSSLRGIKIHSRINPGIGTCSH
jgi:hypothetical protein